VSLGEAMGRVAAWQQAFFTGMRIVFCLVLIFPMLTFGAVEFEPLAVITMVIAISAVLVCWRPIQHPRLSFIAGVALLCLMVLAAVQYGQSLRFPHSPWEHPAWAYVRALVGPVDGAASVTPEQTRADIILWSPLLIFIVALHLFSRRREAFLLLSILSHLVVVVTVISLCQFLFAPMSVGFETKTAYISSLTGFYVNRNSAGTFFGMGIIINAGLLAFYLQNSTLAAFARKIFIPERLSHAEKTTLFLMVGLFIDVLALAATQSRGATASVFIGLICLVWLFNQRKRSRRRSSHQSGARWGRFAFIVSMMSIVAVVVAQETIYRMGAQSVDQARLCTYASTAKAVWDNWPLGSGFGSFADVFPAYRSAQCSGIEGVWDAAHDSYLEGALGLGIAFVAVLAVALVTLVWALVTGLRERRKHRFAPVIGLASLLVVALHSLIDFSLQIPGNALFFAALLAACLTLSLGERTSAKPTSDQKMSDPSEQAPWAAYQS
jgi:hypothetical protein